MTSHKTIPIADLSHEELKVHVEAKYAQIVETVLAYRELDSRLMEIVATNASFKSKYAKLCKLADEINDGVAPYAACKKGCSSCCNIDVNVTAEEARALGERIGVKPQAPSSPPIDVESEEAGKRYFGQPCTFLEGGMCSIYESRPLACRLHHNLAPTAKACSVDITPEESIEVHAGVPALDMRLLWGVYGMLSKKPEAFDLRDFFPNGKKG